MKRSISKALSLGEIKKDPRTVPKAPAYPDKSFLTRLVRGFALAGC